MSHPNEPRIDPERVKPTNAFGASDGVTGQEYSREREEAEARKQPSGHPIGQASSDTTPAKEDGRDIPPDAGRRRYIDPATGEVHGSRSGAGGGSPGKDSDVGTAGGAPEVPQAGAAPDLREAAQQRTPGSQNR